MTARPRRRILIVGGSGHQGGATLDALAASSALIDVSTVTRVPEMAAALQARSSRVFVGDLREPSFAAQALEGVEGLLLHTSFFDARTLQPDFDGELRLARALIEAAARAGVGHIVFSTSPYTGGVRHMDNKTAIEHDLRASGIPHILVSTCNYMDNFALWPMYKPTREGERLVFRLPFPRDRILPTIAVRDIGFFLALCLLHPERFSGRRLRVCGDELTPAEMVAQFSEVTGRAARYEGVNREAWRELGWLGGDDFVAMFEWYARAPAFTDLAESRALHPGLWSWRDWLRRSGWDGR
jgi:uncharacterized protein YbjT (DUF2867 family)